MTILGSFNDGIAGDYELLAIKSLMDGIASMASALGWGVALSILTLLVVSTLPLGTALLDEVTAVGGVILLALVLLDLMRVRAANLLPGLLLGPLIVVVLYAIGVPLAP